MNIIRQAILLAANQIEQHPESFVFESVKRPDGCGTPGCAIGWLGVFLNVPASYGVDDYFDAVLGLLGYSTGSARPFYMEMNGLLLDWAEDAQGCAIALRRYADKHHPELSDELPESILKVFDVSVWA